MKSVWQYQRCKKYSLFKSEIKSLSNRKWRWTFCWGNQWSSKKCIQHYQCPTLFNIHSRNISIWILICFQHYQCPTYFFQCWSRNISIWISHIQLYIPHIQSPTFFNIDSIQRRYNQPRLPKCTLGPNKVVFPFLPSESKSITDRRPHKQVPLNALLDV